MTVYSCVCQACVLIALELEYCLIHKVGVEQTHCTEQLKILYIKVSYFLEKTGRNLGDNITKAALPLVGKIHEYRHTGGKFDKLLLNLFTQGLALFFGVRKLFFLLCRELIFAVYFCFLYRLGFVDYGFNILVEAAEALYAHQRF